MRNVLMSVSLLFAVLSPGFPQTTKSFIRHWRLISYEQRSATGEVIQPFGQDPIGRISYDSGGQMSAQLMRRDRQAFSDNDPQKGTYAEIRSAFAGYAAYYGSYTVDEKMGTVTHHVEVAWFPNWVGMKQVRRYEFSGTQHDKLARTTPLRRLGTMAEVTRVIRFLSDTANTYMTGAILPVNGGAYMP